MPLTPARVECYAGSKAFERPRRVVINGQVYQVTTAIAFSAQADASSRRLRYKYEVLIAGGRRIVLIREGDQWFAENWQDPD